MTAYLFDLDGTRGDKRDLIAHILPRHGFEAARAAMIGDRGVDMRAARHHGLAAIGALWGFGSREELTEGGPRSCARAPASSPPCFRPAAERRRREVPRHARRDGAPPADRRA